MFHRLVSNAYLDTHDEHSQSCVDRGQAEVESSNSIRTYIVLCYAVVDERRILAYRLVSGLSGQSLPRIWPIRNVQAQCYRGIIPCNYTGP